MKKTCNCGNEREPFSPYCKNCLKLFVENANKEHTEIQYALREGKDIRDVKHFYNQIYVHQEGFMFGYSTIQGGKLQ